MLSKKVSFETILTAFGNNTGIVIPEELVMSLESGKKPPVIVTINGFSYKNTVAVMGGQFLVGVNSDIRKKTGLQGGDPIEVTLELDTEPRVLEIPADFQQALDSNRVAKDFFEKLSYSNKQRFVLPLDQTKNPETRQKRIEKAIKDLSEGKK
jgi:Bacteriocin-protection, YdeI or OmpD-Associated/Domain of unknown function (DUF1905)